MAAPTVVDKKIFRRLWPALESNPECLTKLLHEIGVSNEWSFCDVVGIDEEMLGWVPQPCVALILLFPSEEVRQAWARAEEDKLLDDFSNQQPYIRNVGSDAFFIWQESPLGNACGTVAIVHAVANNMSELGLTDRSSPIADFYSQALSSVPKCRGELLQNHAGIHEAHLTCVEVGQTQSLPEDKVDFHFVCLTRVGDKLYELDGARKSEGEILHCFTSQSTFLSDAARIVRMRYIEACPGILNFSVLALTQSK
jgi:ubiquitin carboxyl-terminal hydrolase L3